MDLFSKKANFDDVVKNEEALMFHAVKFQSGFRYELARQCFQHIQQQKIAK